MAAAVRLTRHHLAQEEHGGWLGLFASTASQQLRNDPGRQWAAFRSGQPGPVTQAAAGV